MFSYLASIMCTDQQPLTHVLTYCCPPQVTLDYDMSAPLASPRWTDGLVHFGGVLYEPGVCVIVDVRYGGMYLCDFLTFRRNASMRTAQVLLVCLYSPWCAPCRTVCARALQRTPADRAHPRRVSCPCSMTLRGSSCRAASSQS